MSVRGSGGAGGTNEMPGACDQYAADYETAMTKAKMCDGKDTSCAKLVAAALSGCTSACKTYVDDDGNLQQIRQKWDKAGCVPATCVLVICLTPTGVSCDMSADRKDEGGSKKGTCSDNFLGL